MTRRFWFAVAALFLWGVLGMTPTPAKSATLAGSVAVSLPLGTSRADYSTVPCAIDTQSLTAENAIGNCSLGGLGEFIGEPNPSHRNTIAVVVHSVSPELRATQLDGNTVPPGPNAEYADTIAALSNASAPGVPKPLGAETAIGLVLLGNETPAGLALAARAQFWVARIICVQGKDDGCYSWAVWATEQARDYGVPIVLRVWQWRREQERPSPGGDYTTTDAIAWATIMGGIAEKVSAVEGARVLAIQSENEVDYSGDAWSYAWRTAAAARNIHAVSTIPVWLAGMARADGPFLAETLFYLDVLGARKEIAAVAVHSYNRPDLAVAVARKTVAEMGWGVPVYMTETGHSGDGQVQAEMVAKRIALCAQVHTGLCVAFKAQTHTSDMDDWGLIRADGTPKPAFSTLTGVLSTGDAP